MNRTILLVVLLCVGYPLLFGQKHADHPQVSVRTVGPAAVWDPSPQILSAIREKCGRADPARLDDCFLSEMQSAGASAPAVAFAKSTADKAFAYIRDFLKVGRVDIACVEYPFRANELDGMLLVNGDPPVINVDDQKFLSQDNFSKDPTYAVLAEEYPQISIWPGDRYQTSDPTVQAPESGGQTFVVEYILRDGCHACAQIGTASLIFEFDENGRFTGVRVGRGTWVVDRN
jgi:hypothetical protein